MRSSPGQRLFNPWSVSIPRSLDPALRRPEFETEHEAEEWRRECIRVLSNGTAHRRLAKKLKRCKAGRRCLSGACFVCCRQFRRWYTARIPRLFADEPAAFVASIVRPTWNFPPGQLRLAKLDRMTDQLRQVLKRAGLGHCLVAGGFDVSFNEDNEKTWPPHWSVHVYLIVAVIDRERFKALLRPTLETSPEVERPLRTRDIDDWMAAATYAWKGAFFKRVSYVGDDDGSRTRKLPMKPEQHRELLLFLDRHSMTQRSFLRGIRRRGGELVRE